MQMLKPKHSFESIEAFFMGSVISKAILESVRMRLFDALEMPRTIQEISASMKTSESATEALLNVLEITGLIVKREALYQNTALASEFLVTNSPFYQGQVLELHQGTCDFVVREMPSLLSKPGRVRNHFTEKFASPASLQGMLQYAMRGSLQNATEFIVALPGFMDMRSMCDIGGNHGRYTMALLDRNPHMTAVIVDLPNVTPAIEDLCREAGYGERLSVLAADMRTDDLPEKAFDLVLTSEVLHVFMDDLGSVLEKIATCLKPGGWFVSNHMNPESEAARNYRSIVNLISYLVLGTSHFISRVDLESALSIAGFADFVVGSTSQEEINLILAARKKQKS
ncbi:class I SAM-dependent methyltransferase [Desulfomonile tiedjei]|uniref:Spermidine synthase n=1 Tax=Desulfomonile tiedjei (strain ATCC 49306 / DSM 6799 / DCB-1) TaxID=706587 RepID=I4C2M2_DESTA|nr:class I SAM-dependent methyltransferase [Desulfomonile tiedjei]AFM23813.1 spermidine synthase [Desulfomonile tiedjei DSM 6799]